MLKLANLVLLSLNSSRLSSYLFTRKSFESNIGFHFYFDLVIFFDRLSFKSSRSFSSTYTWSCEFKLESTIITRVHYTGIAGLPRLTVDRLLIELSEQFRFDDSLSSLSSIYFFMHESWSFSSMSFQFLFFVKRIPDDINSIHLMNFGQDD